MTNEELRKKKQVGRRLWLVEWVEGPCLRAGRVVLLASGTYKVRFGESLLSLKWGYLTPAEAISAEMTDIMQSHTTPVFRPRPFMAFRKLAKLVRLYRKIHKLHIGTTA